MPVDDIVNQMNRGKDADYRTKLAAQGMLSLIDLQGSVTKRQGLPKRKGTAKKGSVKRKRAN